MGLTYLLLKKFKIDAFYCGVLTSLEWEFSEYQKGRFEIPVNGWKNIFNDRAFIQQRWSEVKNTYKLDFVEYIEKEIIED